MEEMLPEVEPSNKNFNRMVSSDNEMGFDEFSPKHSLMMTKGIISLRKKFHKIGDLKNKFKNQDLIAQTRTKNKGIADVLKSEKVLLDFDRSTQKVKFNMANMDFGSKSSIRKKKKELEETLKKHRKMKKEQYLRELKHSKNKEKTFQKIANETMVMYSERKMLLKGGDKNRFSEKIHNSSINDIYKDEKLVFNRILKMMYTVITLLFLYALTFIFVYLLNTTYYDAVSSIQNSIHNFYGF